MASPDLVGELRSNLQPPHEGILERIFNTRVARRANAAAEPTTLQTAVTIRNTTDISGQYPLLVIGITYTHIVPGKNQISVFDPVLGYGTRDAQKVGKEEKLALLQSFHNRVSAIGARTGNVKIVPRR